VEWRKKRGNRKSTSNTDSAASSKRGTLPTFHLRIREEELEEFRHQGGSKNRTFTSDLLMFRDKKKGS
jgi:hypothetical protein